MWAYTAYEGIKAKFLFYFYLYVYPYLYVTFIFNRKNTFFLEKRYLLTQKIFELLTGPLKE